MKQLLQVTKAISRYINTWPGVVFKKEILIKHLKISNKLSSLNQDKETLSTFKVDAIWLRMISKRL